MYKNKIENLKKEKSFSRAIKQFLQKNLFKKIQDCNKVEE